MIRAHFVSYARRMTRKCLNIRQFCCAPSHAHARPRAPTRTNARPGTLPPTTVAGLAASTQITLRIVGRPTL